MISKLLNSSNYYIRQLYPKLEPYLKDVSRHLNNPRTVIILRGVGTFGLVATISYVVFRCFYKKSPPPQQFLNAQRIDHLYEEFDEEMDVSSDENSSDMGELSYETLQQEINDGLARANELVVWCESSKDHPADPGSPSSAGSTAGGGFSSAPGSASSSSSSSAPEKGLDTDPNVLLSYKEKSFTVKQLFTFIKDVPGQQSTQKDQNMAGLVIQYLQNNPKKIWSLKFGSETLWHLLLTTERGKFVINHINPKLLIDAEEIRAIAAKVKLSEKDLAVVDILMTSKSYKYNNDGYQHLREVLQFFVENNLFKEVINGKNPHLKIQFGTIMALFFQHLSVVVQITKQERAFNLQLTKIHLELLQKLKTKSFSETYNPDLYVRYAVYNLSNTRYLISQLKEKLRLSSKLLVGGKRIRRNSV